ncbi:polysaccharide deacetylase [Fodinisporobacter ferrooxydans]|uniref:Polysaccharide deacetylase n=1 Tax=Fodinisporobacter ferrooxydans TaxID=2901836 RepID=A0ABY4CEK8_9BACL|nr:polysaccharide deacetylase [Alicyclobacillaceae bacterium MYW30-H2]
MQGQGGFARWAEEEWDRTKETGTFIISLDFELYWGVRDKCPIERYSGHLQGARLAVPAMLELYKAYDVHVTWATVGFLFCRNKRELLQRLPKRQPAYEEQRLSPYPELHQIGQSELDDPFHYAPSLIQLIRSCPHQHIGTHTFSHYYCLAPGQDVYTFQADVTAAIQVAGEWGIKIGSLVFPRNQINEEYLAACAEMGIACYRGNESTWQYEADGYGRNSLLKRALRVADSYLNLSGHHCVSLEDIHKSYPFNIPSSRFLRPYSTRLRVLEPLKLRRIFSGMTFAAKHGLVYHIWWHPHNFGVNLTENINSLHKILKHYKKLQERYGMKSLSMEELSEQILTQAPLGKPVEEMRRGCIL